MLPKGLQYVTTVREMVLENMADEFETWIGQNTGDDWYKIQHIPSIVTK